jgi:sortase A
MRRQIRIAGWTMVWTGLFMLGFAGYQLFITDLFTARSQDVARAELDATFAGPDPEAIRVTVPPELAAEIDAPAGVIEHFDEQPGPSGEPFAAIRIPKIDVDQVVIEGVGRDDLIQGPGHMPWTPLPGQPGNAVISGHRVTYGRPFFDLDQLVPGDVIEVETTVGVHVYTVRELQIVAPTDVWVAGSRRGAWLTLTTCHPRFSAAQRLVVFAELTDGPNLEYVEYVVASELEDVS